MSRAARSAIALAVLLLAAGSATPAALVGNHALVASRDAAGTTNAVCAWALLVNTALVSSSAADSLDLTRPSQPPGTARPSTATSATSARSASQCASTVRNVSVDVRAIAGFATRPPASSGAFASGGAPSALLGNTFGLAGGASGSAWSACQWVLAVNTIIVLDAAPGREPPTPPGAPIGRTLTNATAARSACSLQVANVSVEVQTSSDNP